MVGRNFDTEGNPCVGGAGVASDVCNSGHEGAQFHPDFDGGGKPVADAKAPYLGGEGNPRVDGAGGVRDSVGDGSSLGSVGNIVVPPSAGMPRGEGGDDESSFLSLRSDWSQPRKLTRAFCRLRRAPRKRAIAAQVRAANEGGYHKQLVTIGCMVNKCRGVTTL